MNFTNLPLPILQVWLNSLWPIYNIWWHRSGSALVQVMACCLTAPSHYLNQCWLLASNILWHSPGSNLEMTGQAPNLYNEFEKYTFKISATPPRCQWVNGTCKHIYWTSNKKLAPHIRWEILHLLCCTQHIVILAIPSVYEQCSGITFRQSSKSNEGNAGKQP